MVKNLSRISIYLICWFIFSSDSSIRAEAGSICAGDLETLSEQMLIDLPSYANRVMQRSRPRQRREKLIHYIVVAGRPEFEPLPLTRNESQYKSVYPDTTKQIFFTTLERQYSQTQVVNLENYHWLFLTETERGWQVVTLFSQFSSSNSDHPPSPPRNTTHGVIGQAVNLWLRDCNFSEIQAK